jgi:hypothetical protein
VEDQPDDPVEAYLVERNRFANAWFERDEAMVRRRAELAETVTNFIGALREMFAEELASRPIWEHPKTYGDGATVRSDGQAFDIMSRGVLQQIAHYLTDDAELHAMPARLLDAADDLTDGLGLTRDNDGDPDDPMVP